MHTLLQRYCQIADVIAGTFGSRCEAVVHDLSQPESSVVYVANGSVTDRAVGQSFDHLVRQVLMNKKFKDDRAINYVFEMPDHRKIRSSSLLIRDEEDKIVGMLCINYDIPGWLQMQEELGRMLCLEPAEALPQEEKEVTPDEIGRASCRERVF